MSEFEPFYVVDFLVKKPLKSNGAGTAIWGICEKDHVKYFLKEFLDPKYPDESAEMTDIFRKSCIDCCENWYRRHGKLYAAITKIESGNIIKPKRFFRHENKYYLITEYVEGEPFDTIYKKSMVQKLVLMKLLAHEYMLLEKNHVVHADVKPKNLIVKKTIDDWHTIKVIDFDDSFLEDDVPQEVPTDQNYASPEALKRSYQVEEEEDEENLEPISTKADVFSVGILFHQILSNGDMPLYRKFEKGKEDDAYLYFAESLLHGEPLKLSEKIPGKYQILLCGMLEVDVKKRLSMSEVFYLLQRMDSLSEKDIMHFLEEKTKSSKSSSFQPAGDL